jgi:CheY-like chemotaxis protein
MTQILVVDPNEAFATLLVEELERQGYDVVMSNTYVDAEAAIDASSFDLALLDMGLEEPGALTLAENLREAQPEARLMLIPLMGEKLPEDARSRLSIQGVLPKPFFLPELPDRIGAALEAPLEAEPTAEVDAAEEEVEQAREEPAVAAQQPESPPVIPGAISAKVVAQHRAAIERVMRDLAQDISADVVLLSVRDHLAAWVGSLDEVEAEAMAQAVIQSSTTSSEVGRILGHEQVRFEQSISGGDYVLYALSIDAAAILTVAIRGTTALGLLRHQARGAASDIARICGVELSG